MNKYGKKWIPDTNEKRLHELCLTFLCDNLNQLDIRPFFFRNSLLNRLV